MPSLSLIKFTFISIFNEEVEYTLYSVLCTVTLADCDI